MKKLKRKLLPLLLSAAMVVSLIPSFTPVAWAAATTYDISSGSVTISSAGDYVISGSSTTNTITVISNISGNVNIMLSGVQIDVSSSGSGAFFIGLDSSVNLTLSGTNILKSGYEYAGIYVPLGSTITITDDKTNDGAITDSLTATGGRLGAGIGGEWGNGSTIVKAGNITISGGNVTANGGASSAGIGGGYSGDGGNVAITGGTVTAYNNGGEGADIGGGNSGVGGYSGGGTLTVTGTAAPLPVVKFASSGTNAATTFKNCTIINNANGEMTGTYDAFGYIPVSVSLSTSVAGVLTTTVSGYSGGGNVQFSYKADGATAFTNLGSAVPVSSGSASVNFSPTQPGSAALPGNYAINAVYYSSGGHHKGSDTGSIAIGDATLASLGISSGTLSPSFNPSITSYTVNAGYAIPSVTVTPTVNDAGATVKVNGTAVTSGFASGSIALTPGAPTSISIVVTGKDGVTTNTYTVTVAVMTYSQAIDANSLQNLKAPIGVNQYQHLYYGGTYWRVLNNYNGQLYLLANDVVASMAFRSDFRQSDSNQYSNSDARRWLLNTFLGRFSAGEQSVMTPNVSCYSDKIFLLSEGEINFGTYFPGIGGYNGLSCDSRSASVSWWLRTSCGKDNYNQPNMVGYILNNGYDMCPSKGSECDMVKGIRPGTLLNLSSVLHVSPATEGASASVDASLITTQQVTDNAKLTLIDSAQTLTIDSVSAEDGKSGGTVTVSYSGASTGTSQYLCVNLASGSSSYKGVIKALTLGSESGTATFTLPADITPGQYALRFWNEQYNAAQCTNYATALIDKTIAFNTPVIARDILPTGTIGIAYQKAVTVDGGTAPYTWSATGLPKGLSIGTDGKITGTPEYDVSHSLGTPCSVEITITDANGKTDTWITSMTISQNTANLLSAAADGAENSAYSTQIDLTFDKAVAGLSADNITLTNGTGAAVKGALTGSGTNWSIALTSVTTQGNVSVSVSAPQGYTIAGSPKIVAVYKQIISAGLSPVSGSFDKRTPADVQTTVTWGSATSVTDVKRAGSSIGAGNYNVSGNTLVIKKEYLATHATGGLPLTVEFNAGVAATLTITVTDTTPPSISPTSRKYDLSTPADVTTTITWNSTASVANMVYSVNPDTALYTMRTGDYAVAGNALTIKKSFFSGLNLTTGAALEFDITFDTGVTAALTVNIVDGYMPSDDADLSNISVNGSPVTGFDPDDIEYAVELPFGSSGATVTATASDSNAQVSITQASNLPGSATVTVTAENGATTRTYTINLTTAPSAFVPVMGITDVPTAVTAGVNLPLSGTVAPANATNKTIVWSVYSAGDTGATISGNILSTTAAGDVIVKGTITNGLTASSDYTKNFTITVSAVSVSTYIVTFNSNGVVYASKTVNDGQSIGSTAWPADPSRNSYTFGGWFTGENGAGTQVTSATPVNATITVYAKWTYSGGGGTSSGGGSTTPATSTYNAEVNAGNGSNVKLPVTVDKSGGTASVDISSGNSLLSAGKTTVITVPAVPGVDTYILGIPVPSLSTQDEQGSLAFKTDMGTVTIPSNMLTSVARISGSKAEISIGQGNKDSLSSDVKAAIGDRTLISLSLSIDRKQTDWSNPNAPVTVSIPYTPTAAELANPEGIVIWYIDVSGNAVCIPNGHYDSATGTVTFSTTHFSYYAVVYNKVSFKDVAANAWYNKAVGFIAARGITTGTGNGNYSPDVKLTRGEFIVMMMKAYGIAPDTNPKTNFTDAGSTYYTGYLAAAKQLGISTGVGNNMFAPDKQITRQEMFTLLYNALKIIGQLPEGTEGKALSDFTDAGDVASWAKDSMTLMAKTGTISGSGGKLSPSATATRAEMAQVLYNLLAK